MPIISEGRVIICFVSLRTKSRSAKKIDGKLARHHSGVKPEYDISIYNEDTGDLIARSQDQTYRMNQWIVPEQ